MPRYHFKCTFPYAGDPEAIHLGLKQWLHALSDVEIAVDRSANPGVPPVEFFREALAPGGEDPAWIAFQLRGDGGNGRGTLTIAQPSGGREPSILDVQFSVNAKGKGLFASGEAARHALLSAAHAFGAESGQVEADDFSDEESSRKYAVFQRLRDRRIPVNFEWVTVIRSDVFRSIGWAPDQLAAVPGIRFGEDQGFVWIVLSDAPFSYKTTGCTDAQRRLEAALDLRAKQEPR